MPHQNRGSSFEHGDFWEGFDYPVALHHQKFGEVLEEKHYDKLGFEKCSPIISNTSISGLSKVTCDDTTFNITLSIAPFDPKDYSVFVTDQYVIVKAKQDNAEDQNNPGHKISRVFTRKFPFPRSIVRKNYSAFVRDGLLHVNFHRDVIPRVQEITIDKSGKAASAADDFEVSLQTETESQKSTENEQGGEGRQNGDLKTDSEEDTCSSLDSQAEKTSEIVAKEEPVAEEASQASESTSAVSASQASISAESEIEVSEKEAEKKVEDSKVSPAKQKSSDSTPPKPAPLKQKDPNSPELKRSAGKDDSTTKLPQSEKKLTRSRAAHTPRKELPTRSQKSN